MPWYKSGTVSVTQNSNAVIGTGTAFIANSRVGDGFRGPDGRWYEVTNIASNTALSISPNYEGSTVAGGFYAIMPVQGYQKDLADQVRDILNDYGGVLAVLGTTPTTAGVREELNLTDTDGLPEGEANKYLTNARVLSSVLTGLDASSAGAVVAADSILAAIGKLQAAKAGKGANNDITSIIGLTTALAVNQGGTGVTTTSALLTALQAEGAYGKSNVVGTVSKSNGVPTGAIIERGSGANGNFVKWADGTMICTRSFALQTVAANGTINLGAQSFASAFSSIPTLSFSTSSDFPYDITGSAETGTTTTSFRWSGKNRNTSNSIGFYLSVIAIGRWFQ